MYFSVCKMALAGAMIVVILASADGARPRGVPVPYLRDPPKVKPKPKVKIPQITWIKNDPAREWEVDDFEHVTTTPQSMHVEYSRGSDSTDPATRSYDVTITNHPANYKYKRKTITAKLLAANVVAVYLQTEQEKFWQRRDRLRQSDNDYVNSVLSKPAAPIATKPPAEPEYRTWTTGGEKIEAAFRGMIGDQVTIAKKDGAKVKAALGELSDEDQAWIRKRTERNGGDFMPND